MQRSLATVPVKEVSNYLVGIPFKKHHTREILVFLQPKERKCSGFIEVQI